MAWTNDDGLVVRFGTERSAHANAAEYTTDGPRRFIEIILDAERAPAVADGSVRLSEEVKLPAGVMVEDVEIVGVVDFTGSGTLNLGVEPVDGTTADVDYFIEAATVAELNAGGVDIAGWTGDGSPYVVNPKLSYLTWEVDTAALAAGSATIRIHFSVPESGSDTLIQS